MVVTPPPVEKQVVSTVVSADEGRRVPGTQGDVLKVVENMPGVARAALGSANIVVWGAAPEDTRVYLDGVPLPALYHQGGFRSVVHSDMVDSVELLPGGWGAEYGRGIGGLVDVHLKALDQDGFHGSASSDLIDSSVDVRDRLSDHVGVEIAGRKSYLDQLLPVFTSSNIGQYIPIPRYYDAQARIVWDLAPGESLELGGLLSADAVDDTVPSDEPRETSSSSRTTRRSSGSGSDGRSGRRTEPRSTSSRRSGRTPTHSSIASARFPRISMSTRPWRACVRRGKSGSRAGSP